jgi:hypothetical protein
MIRCSTRSIRNASKLVRRQYSSNATGVIKGIGVVNWSGCASNARLSKPKRRSIQLKQRLLDEYMKCELVQPTIEFT